MSAILEKTLASLPGLITESLGHIQTGNSPSRSFQNFVKGVGNLKTKYEEEQFINKELSLQKQRLSQPDITAFQKRESLMKLVYCCMLGYDVTFAGIHAIKLAQQGSILEKRVGYLVCCLFLHENHELVVLIINTLQKDLRSTNILVICTALVTITHLVSVDMIPTFLPLVQEKLRHPKELVRKKAVLCLCQFVYKAPHLYSLLKEDFRKALCDTNVGVMWAALQVYLFMTKSHPENHLDLITGLVGILQQVSNRRLSTEYDYHSVPAPWLTIHTLKILARLGKVDHKASEKMFPVLKEVLQRTEPTHKMGLAVIYECLETIVATQQQSNLLENAASCVGRFVSAKAMNLKYIGLKILTCVVRINPRLVVEHQSEILDCLDHEDLTIQTKTLDLLYRMANPQNVRAICGKMLQFIANQQDKYLKADIINKTMRLTERFSQDVEWYANTMNGILLTAAQHDVISGVALKIVTFIQKECSCKDDNKRQKMCVIYWTLLQRDRLPDDLLQVATWVLGEYAMSLPVPPGPAEVASTLVHWFHKATATVPRVWILSALVKIASISKLSPTLIKPLEDKSDFSTNKEITQRLSELLSVVQCNGELSLHLCNNLTQQFDFSLSFLDDYVSRSLEGGGKPYNPHHCRIPDNQPVKQSSNLFAGLNMAPYDSPVLPSGGSGSTRSVHSAHSVHSSGSGVQDTELGVLKISGVKKVWGPQGVIVHAQSENVQLDVTETTDDNQENALGEVGADHTLIEERERRQELADELFRGVVEHSTSPSVEGEPAVKAFTEPSWSTDILQTKPTSPKIYTANNQPPPGGTANLADLSSAMSSQQTVSTSDHPIKQNKSNNSMDALYAAQNNEVSTEVENRTLAEQFSSQGYNQGNSEVYKWSKNGFGVTSDVSVDSAATEVMEDSESDQFYSIQDSDVRWNQASSDADSDVRWNQATSDADSDVRWNQATSDADSDVRWNQASSDQDRTYFNLTSSQDQSAYLTSSHAQQTGSMYDEFSQEDYADFVDTQSTNKT